MKANNEHDTRETEGEGSQNERLEKKISVKHMKNELNQHDQRSLAL